MTTSDNFPQAGVQPIAVKKNHKNLIIGCLSAVCLGLSGYLLYDNSKNNLALKEKEDKISMVTTEKSNLQTSFDASLARLDSMSTINLGLQSELTDKNQEIAKVKNDIRSILNKKNATAAELAKARELIGTLNTKIGSLEADVARLTNENQALSNDKVVLTQEKQKLNEDLAKTTVVKQELEKKVDIASTLNASNIMITPINVKSGGKEKVSTTAKRVDKLLISFDVNNRIAQAGTTDVYVLVIGPDGKPITSGSETFATREEGEKGFTAKLPVEVETAKKKNVEFAFAPGTAFQTGSYKVQIYQNGFLIGESVQELKKGGLFS